MTLDFNHGAARPADDPRSRDISERINSHIDAAFATKRDAQRRREYVGASAIGNPCLRALQYGYVGAPVDEGRMTGKALRIFQVGHVFEDEVARWIQSAGFHLDVLDGAGKQFGWSALDGKAKGHVDGIVYAGPIPMQYPAIWECKALNEKGWQDVKKRGLALAKPIYAAQIAINQAYMNLTAPALFTALNKNTEELHHELVPFDKELAQRMSDKLAQIVSATEQEVLLPRAFASADYYECKWCDFHKKCWGK